MSEKILFDIAIVMLSGLVCGRLVKHLKMPNVTGYSFGAMRIECNTRNNGK